MYVKAQGAAQQIKIQHISREQRQRLGPASNTARGPVPTVPHSTVPYLLAYLARPSSVHMAACVKQGLVLWKPVIGGGGVQPPESIGTSTHWS